MKTNQFTQAIEVVKTSEFKKTLSTVAHYVSAKGRISAEQGVNFLISDLRLSFGENQDIQVEAINTALTYMVNNFWQDMADNGYTMEKQEDEYCKDLELMLQDRATAIFMAMDNYDYETWEPIWVKYQAIHRVNRLAC